MRTVDLTDNQVYSNKDTAIAFEQLLKDFINTEILMAAFKKVKKHLPYTKENVFTYDQMIIEQYEEPIAQRLMELKEVIYEVDFSKVNTKELATKLYNILEGNHGRRSTL